LNYTWRSLNDALATMSEEQVRALLDEELLGERRIKIMERLHQRYNTLRVARERIAMFAGAKQL
jgi:hypothetical protein